MPLRDQIAGSAEMVLEGHVEGIVNDWWQLGRRTGLAGWLRTCGPYLHPQRVNTLTNLDLAGCKFLDECNQGDTLLFVLRIDEGN
ncbi:MAG: hypothetical protein ACKOI2_02125 [Actinomycetota bacterium]